MILTKDNAYTSGEKLERLTRVFNIHCISCIGSLIYLLSTIVYLRFVAHKLAKFSSNPGEAYCEGLVYLLINIRYNNILGLNYYADMKDTPLSYLLRQDNNNTENQLMVFYDHM